MNDNDLKIIESYQKHQRLFSVSKELDLPWQTVYWKLKKHGINVTGNKQLWGSTKDKFAVKGELIFKELVKSSINKNEIEYQSKVDFIVRGYLVDIKCSKLKQGDTKYKNKRWAFSLSKQIELADFYVCFCFDSNGIEILKTILIPRDMIIDMQTISISEKISKWDIFEVKKEDLNDFFTNLPNK